VTERAKGENLHQTLKFREPRKLVQIHR